jgi:hypothetical protein
VTSGVWPILRPSRWRRHVPPKRWLTFKGLHGVISQMTEAFITTAVRTSNPAYVSKIVHNFPLSVHANARIVADEIFSDCQPCKLVKNSRHFRDHLCPHHQGQDHQTLVMGTQMVPETSVIYNQLTRLMAREQIFNFSRRESVPSYARKAPQITQWQFSSTSIYNSLLANHLVIWSK